MKRFLAVITLALTSVVVLSSSALGSAPSPSSGVSVDSQRVAGFASGQLLGEEYRQLLELPPDVNPLAGNGNNCLSAGNRGQVLILFTVPAPAPAAECAVKPGTPVFFSSLGGECSSAEAAPFFGKTERQQRRCILDYIRSTPFDAILVRIDGRPPVKIGSDPFLAVAPQRTAHLPDPNILGVKGNQRATFVAAAYSVLLRPLATGTHTISVQIIGGPYAGTNRAVIHVVAGQQH